nr:MAG TPA: hypothetical protein [Caudoviricetes sp.]
MDNNGRIPYNYWLQTAILHIFILVWNCNDFLTTI